MAQRSLAWTELRVGILVLFSFFLLALAIFYIGGEGGGFFAPKYTVTAFFRNANNLKSGGEVQLEGVTIGNVTDVIISRQSDPNKAVEATLKLEKKYQNIIRTDSPVNIKTIGLLGDKFVEIGRGTEAGQVVQEGGTLQGTEEGDIQRIIQGTDDIVANLEVLSDKITKMAERVDRGEGTLGKFLTDSAIYDNANLVVKEANLLVKDARTGRGTIGKFMSDDELYRRTNEIAQRVDTLITKIESGNGTAGKLINDPSVYNKADALIAKFDAIADRVDRGEGTLGKLLKDEALHNEVRNTVARLNALAESIENGTGTVGKFIKDPTLYNTANQASSEILKLLYDFRQDPKKYLTINFRLF